MQKQISTSITEKIQIKLIDGLYHCHNYGCDIILGFQVVSIEKNCMKGTVDLSVVIFTVHIGI